MQRSLKGNVHGKSKLASGHHPARDHQRMDTKKTAVKDRRRVTARKCGLLFLLLRRQTLEGKTEKFTDTRVLLLRVAFQHRTLVGGDSHRDLTMRNRVRLAVLEVEIFHCEADNFTGRLKAVTITSRFDLGDKSQGKIKRQWGGAFLCASGHSSKAAGGSMSSALAPAHTDLGCEQRYFSRTYKIDADSCSFP